METGHKHLAEQKTLTDEDMLRLEPFIKKLSEEIAAHQEGRTLKTIAGRLVVPKNNVAVMVAGSDAEAGLVQSAISQAMGGIGPLKSELLVTPSADADYATIRSYPYVLPVAADLNSSGPVLEWFICDIVTITNERSYDAIIEKLAAADNYLRFGGEKPMPLPKQPPIAGQLGQIAASSRLDRITG